MRGQAYVLTAFVYECMCNTSTYCIISMLALDYARVVLKSEFRLFSSSGEGRCRGAPSLQESVSRQGRRTVETHISNLKLLYDMQAIVPGVFYRADVPRDTCP